MSRHSRKSRNGEPSVLADDDPDFAAFMRSLPPEQSARRVLKAKQGARFVGLSEVHFRRTIKPDVYFGRSCGWTLGRLLDEVKKRSA